MSNCCYCLCSDCQGLREKVSSLQAIVDKLLKTADNVPIVPGMKVWQRIHPPVGDGIMPRYAFMVLSQVQDELRGMSDIKCRSGLVLCCSTRKAAEQVLEKYNADN